MTVYGYLGLGEDKCPICSGKRVVKGVNDLATLTPALADEWSPRNTINPTEVTNQSNKKVWWVCNKGHEWEATIGSRNQGGGCPYCCNKKVLKGFNDLATTHPELLQEWDFEKNETKPTELTAHSGKKIWWRCPKCGYSWETPPAYRVRSKSISGCPSCVGTAVHPGFNDLETKYPQVAKHWDYSLNKDLLPSMFRPRSETEVWWNCEKGHKYKKRISMAVKLRQCPICKEEKRKLKQKKIMMD